MDQIRKSSLNYEGVCVSQARCKYLFHFGNDECDSFQILYNHSYKYFGPVYACTSLMAPTGWCRVVLSIAAVMCRSLKTWPGTTAGPLEHSYSCASSAGGTLSAPLCPWPGCYSFPTFPFWLCHPRNILMDSLTCYLFWDAGVSKIITSQHILPQWTSLEQWYVFVVTANWHPV